MAYGFGTGKNKENVYKTDEVYTKTESNALLLTKQDQHIAVTGTLAAVNWSSKAQTISVTGVTADNTVIVAALPADADKYAFFGVRCTAQGAGTLTFGCDFTPDADIVVNVVILGVPT